MRKPKFAADKKSLFRSGAVLSLTLLMALQTVGCGAGADKKETPAVQTEAGTVQADTAAQTDTAAQAASKNGSEAGSDGAADSKDGDDAAAGEGAVKAGEGETAADAGEGDSGIEPQPGAPLKSGNKAPDFTAELIDGSTITLSDLKGKPVIINFWATWCGPCVREMPAFERLKEDFGDEIGIIAVNCGDDADTVKDFASENGYTFPIALDESYEVTMLYPTNSIPYTVVIDANGKITHISAGAADADTMYGKYKEALGL